MEENEERRTEGGKYLEKENIFFCGEGKRNKNFEKKDIFFCGGEEKGKKITKRRKIFFL